MKNLVAKIQELIAKDAVHRKGFRIREATPVLAASNIIGELGELLVDCELKKLDKAKVELADVLGVVFHLAVMLDVPISELEQIAIGKLGKRFGIPDEDGFAWTYHGDEWGIFHYQGIEFRYYGVGNSGYYHAGNYIGRYPKDVKTYCEGLSQC